MKIIAIVALLIIAMQSASGTAILDKDWSEYQIFQANDDDINIREQANISSKVIGKLSRGEIIFVDWTSSTQETIGNRRGFWYKCIAINQNFSRGYCFSPFFIPARIKEKVKSKIEEWYSHDDNFETIEKAQLGGKISRVGITLQILSGTKKRTFVDDSSDRLGSFSKTSLVFTNKHGFIVLRNVWYEGIQYYFLSPNLETIYTSNHCVFFPNPGGNLFAFVTNGDDMQGITNLTIINSSYKVVKELELSNIYQITSINWLSPTFLELEYYIFHSHDYKVEGKLKIRLTTTSTGQN